MADNMDEQVRQLIELVNTKENEIKKAANPTWETNCVFKNNEITKNIRSISDIKDAIHYYKFIINDQELHTKACNDLGVEDDYMFNGYSLKQWRNDFCNIVNNISLNSKKKSLSVLKAKLDKLVSEDERKRIELENIKKELGV